ncbi:MAG: Arsenite efflux pump ACR3 [Candidatus Methanohalarchaeum thermophilum]|uniref:Arsenite efflux pump ACR3 n=1 Tax=Methanohalarchaeum thermophilum TaxID=1903181 RepID=A0A1Q6DWH9_METT1|nr:MAG: Arsenite efflux pump ACR3 [Candidatus Methanohalarchaeum thermophilum]
MIPAIPNTLGKLEYAHINIPIAVLIWFMIYPTMAEINFKSIIEVKKDPKAS